MSAPHGTEPDGAGLPDRRAATPDTVTWISLGLLVVFALLLLARLGVQFWSARRSPGQARRRASGWVIDLALIGLLLYVGLGRK